MNLSDTGKARHEVLSYPVDLVDKEKALQIVFSSWNKSQGMHIVTLNAEMVVAAQQDEKLDKIIREAELVIPDGSGIVFALRLSGFRMNRLPGIDLASALLSLAASCGRGVALVGGRQEIINKLLEVLPRLHPGLNVAASHHGYYLSEEEAAVIEELKTAKPGLLLVALGAPRQEYFIQRWRQSFPQATFIGVGGSFDVWAGKSTRAPDIFQKLHLEWFYRLLSEPWRFRRMSRSLPYFGFQVLMKYLGDVLKLKLSSVRNSDNQEARGKKNSGARSGK